MDAFATTTLYGTVSTPPEEKYYGLQQPRKFYELTVSVDSAQGKRMMFPVAVFDEGLMMQVQQLTINQRVLVTCALQNKPWQGKDGKWRADMSLRARSIVAGQSHATQRATPQQPQQQGGWTPPRNAQQAYEQRRAAAPTPQMSQEEEEDIPF